MIKVQQPQQQQQQQGFTLLEVMVAIVIFSFGLLGIAGMMTISVRNNHNGYLRSQANFLAENMSERMRANQVGLWNGAYSGTATTGTQNCSVAVPCNFALLAQMDMEHWAQALTNLLPNGQGTIVCQLNGALPTGLAVAEPPSIWSPVPPYDGTCTITVTWDESNGDSAAEQQSMELVVNP